MNRSGLKDLLLSYLHECLPKQMWRFRRLRCPMASQLHEKKADPSASLRMACLWAQSFAVNAVKRQRLLDFRVCTLIDG